MIAWQNLYTDDLVAAFTAIGDLHRQILESVIPGAPSSEGLFIAARLITAERDRALEELQRRDIHMEVPR